MISRTVSVFWFLVLGTGLATAGVIRDGTLRAESLPSGVSVQWVSEDETGVACYLIERSQSGGDSFIPLMQRFAAKGSGQSYQFLDETAFKTTDSFYRYRITPLDGAGNVVGGGQYYTGLIRKVINSVHRTWGSIKAMFR